MSDINEVWKRNEPDSPCIKVCVIHPEAKICMGCHRTGAEIAAWRNMAREDRLALMEELPARADQLKPKRRGGRRR